MAEKEKGRMGYFSAVHKYKCQKEDNEQYKKCPPGSDPKSI